MNKTKLLKRIEDIRHELYMLSDTSELNSQKMIDCSKKLDQLLNLYQTKYASQPHKYKQQKY